MRKLLSIEKKPLIQVYQHHAYGFSILGNGRESRIWAYNKYIQLVFTPAYGLNSFNYFVEFMTKQAPFIWEGCNDITISHLKINILEYIKNGINQNEYAWLCIDEYYIPDSPSYNEGHYLHDVLIYGYDDNKEEFYKMGYNKTKHYCSSTIKYDDFIKSSPILIKFLSKNDKYVYQLDVNNIKDEMENYLNLKKENNIDNIEFQTDYYWMYGLETNQQSFFGIEACQKVHDIICSTILKKGLLDLRPSVLIAEHKRIMYERLKILSSEKKLDASKIISKYSECVKYSIIYKNLCLKYNIKKDSKIINDLNFYMDKMIQNEKYCLLSFIKKI